VAAATRAGQKMRVVTRYSHSFPKLVCTDGKDGTLISTKFLNHVVTTNPEAKTLTVESGVTLRQLIEEAAKFDLALPYAPYWWGLTVGGMMGTGAHGSSLWGKGSAVHDYVTEIRLVSPGLASDGYVKVQVLSETIDPEEFRAAKVSLGVLGVISQVTFELQPMFKRSLNYVMRNDSDFGDQAVSFGERHEFADFLWLPSQGKVVYRMDGRVPLNTSGDGLFEFFPFRSQLSLVLAIDRSLGKSLFLKIINTNIFDLHSYNVSYIYTFASCHAEESEESLEDANMKCVRAKLVSSSMFLMSYGVTNNGISFTCLYIC